MPGFSGTKTDENSPSYTPYILFHVPLMPPQGWRKVIASEMCSLSLQVQRSDGLRWPGGQISAAVAAVAY